VFVCVCVRACMCDCCIRRDVLVTDVDMDQQVSETNAVKADTDLVRAANVSDSESSADDSKQLHSYYLLVS